MKKLDFVKAIKEDTGWTVADIETAYDAFCKAIREAVINGEDVTLVGVGTFKSKDVPARSARNPQNGEVVEVPAKKKVTFSVSKTFKSAINQ